ncbi:SseB family protein [Arcanobacterium hippocoleae]|uniref:SseB family protein n=1 Tax=Arcanobacterium hippocoleae TaxID=149017 RepID=UPI00333E4A24
MSAISKLSRPNPFAGDLGELQQALALAFAEPVESRTSAVVGAMARVLIAALAHPHPQLDNLGKVQAHSAESDPLNDDATLFRGEFMGGRRAIEIFSDADTLFQRYPKARPVPVMISDIARLALQRGDGLMVLNPNTEQTQYLGRSAVIALATQTPWEAPWEDPQILIQLRETITLIDPISAQALQDLQIMPGEFGVCILTLVISQQTQHSLVHRLIRAVLSTIQADRYLRARLDALEIRPILG